MNLKMHVPHLRSDASQSLQGHGFFLFNVFLSSTDGELKELYTSLSNPLTGCLSCTLRSLVHIASSTYFNVSVRSACSDSLRGQLRKRFAKGWRWGDGGDVMSRVDASPKGSQG
jgi:hypothetical protein